MVDESGSTMPSAEDQKFRQRRPRARKDRARAPLVCMRYRALPLAGAPRSFSEDWSEARSYSASSMASVGWEGAGQSRREDTALEARSRNSRNEGSRPS